MPTTMEYHKPSFLNRILQAYIQAKGPAPMSSASTTQDKPTPAIGKGSLRPSSDQHHGIRPHIRYSSSDHQLEGSVRPRASGLCGEIPTGSSDLDMDPPADLDRNRQTNPVEEERKGRRDRKIRFSQRSK